MLFNNRAYLPVKSGRQPNIERLRFFLFFIVIASFYIHNVILFG